MRAAVVIFALALAAAPAAAGPTDHVLPLPPETASTAAPSGDVADMRTACEHADKTCDPYQLLAPLERRAVERALDAGGLAPDHAPAGKKIGKLHFVQLPVFGPGDGFLRWFNIFHVTTRSSTVEKLLGFTTGDTWNQVHVEEAARRLRDPISTSLVAIVPIASRVPGTVDVLCVTRDVWSIRLNSAYEVQREMKRSRFTKLDISLSENNLLGLHKLLAANFAMDQGHYFVGPIYIDKNLLGRHFEVVGRAGPVFSRVGNKSEGSQSSLVVGRPLWSLSSRWGATLAWNHEFDVVRYFQGFQVATWDDPSTTATEAFPLEYHERHMDLTATGSRQWNDAWTRVVSTGVQVIVERPTTLASFTGTAAQRRAFLDQADAPRSERTSAVFVGASASQPRYRNFQDIATYELAEDTQMGAKLSTTVSVGLRLIGSETNFVRFDGAASYAAPLGDDGLWRASLSGSTRLEPGNSLGFAINNTFEGDLRLVTPSLRYGRLVSELTVSGTYRDPRTRIYSLGGDTGLRGYSINEFPGDRRVVWETELRTKSIPIMFTRWGAVLFHDLGGADASFDEMSIYQDVGVGLRFLVPELTTELFRFDLSVPLRTAPLSPLDPQPTRAGTLRFTAGYGQTF